MNLLSPTLYEIKLLRKCFFFTIITLITIYFLINLINFIITDPVKVSGEDYILKKGFPLFTSRSAYISLLKKYPYNYGTKIHFYKIQKRESFWNICQKFQIKIETLIAANPFLKSLSAKEGIEIIIPAEDGVLAACSNLSDAKKMAKLLGLKEQDIKGDISQSLFNIFLNDDIRFVFFKNSFPVIVNNYMTELCNIKRNFGFPCNRKIYSSLYGIRIDPFTRLANFHDGIDILGTPGSPIYPVRKGIVSYTGWRDGFGHTVIIIHADGYTSLYAHCSKIKTRKGAFVGKDDIIATVGSTGRSTGPHLHLSIHRHGQSINPLYFIW